MIAASWAEKDTSTFLEEDSYFQMIGQNVDERKIDEWLQADTSDNT